MVTREINGASLVGYLVGVAWKLLLGKSLVASGRFVMFTPLQFHSCLFCCKD